MGTIFCRFLYIKVENVVKLLYNVVFKIRFYALEIKIYCVYLFVLVKQIQDLWCSIKTFYWFRR